MDEIPARRGRHYFGTLDPTVDQVSRRIAVSSPLLASSLTGPGFLRLQEDVFVLSEEVSDDGSARGTSIDRVESAGVSALISEGVELLENLEPALSRELLGAVQECPSSPLGSRLASKLADVSSASVGALRGECGAGETLNSTEQDYTMSGDESGDGVQQQATQETGKSSAPSSPRIDDLTASDDIRAVFESCLESGVRASETSFALIDPVRLRSALLAHGFTSKQSNSILTRLEEEDGETGGQKVSLGRLRSVMIPILQDCEQKIDLHSKKDGDSELLDNSAVSMISGDVDATLGAPPSTPEKCGLPAAPSPWKEESAVAARSESTQMESMCLSDIAENTKEQEQSESTWSLSEATSTNITPQKAYSQKTVSADAEEKARRIAAVCKKGVWEAWRGNPHGLEPIYSISLWQQTQTLMISCGLVDVLEMLLAGVTAELLAQGQQEVPADRKLRVRLDGTVVQHSKFCKKHTVLVRRIVGILINLALRKKGAESCRRAAGAKND